MTVCFKLLFNLAVGFGLFVVSIIYSAVSASRGHGRRVLVGAEDLSSWLRLAVRQDIVRLECGRPFVEGGRAMMAAAVEAADSDWWSAELNVKKKIVQKKTGSHSSSIRQRPAAPGQGCRAPRTVRNSGAKPPSPTPAATPSSSSRTAAPPRHRSA